MPTLTFRSHDRYTYNTRKKKLLQKENVRRGASFGVEGCLESKKTAPLCFVLVLQLPVVGSRSHSHKVRRQLTARREPHMIHGRKAKAKMKPR